MTDDLDICPACGYEHTKGMSTRPDVWRCRNARCGAILVCDPRRTPRNRLATEEERNYREALSRYNIGIAVPDVPPPMPESLR